MDNRPPLTAAGAERLREELERLRNVERPRIIQAIAEARAHGDLRENAEYHAAREQQSFLEGRIAEIEQQLSLAHIVDPGAVDVGSRVVFGATVQLLVIETEEEHEYQIVGEIEADITEGRVSITSPLGRALIGNHEGDTVVVRAPAGDREYEIVSVVYR